MVRAAQRIEGVRKIDFVFAVAPGIGRVAVAHQRADDLLDLGAQFGRQRIETDTGLLGKIEDQFGLAARRGDDGVASPLGTPRALAYRQHFGHLIEIVDLDGTVGAQHLRQYP